MLCTTRDAMRSLWVANPSVGLGQQMRASGPRNSLSRPRLSTAVEAMRVRSQRHGLLTCLGKGRWLSTATRWAIALRRHWHTVSALLHTLS